jgi:hypothetical protein
MKFDMKIMRLVATPNLHFFFLQSIIIDINNSTAGARSCDVEMKIRQLIQSTVVMNGNTTLKNKQLLLRLFFW